MTTPPGRDILTVTRLNREARRLLEDGLPMLWVEGEISNLALPASGHWYFSLKDANAQIRCAMFRGRNRQLNLRPRNGMQVIVRGRVSLYEPRGDYQLIAEHVREAGEGALQLAFEKLKTRLAAEGLFDEDRKKPLPRIPKRIGLVTSPSGAAVRDVLQVLKRRFAGIPVRIYPVPVQGDSAAPAIAAAIELAGERRDCDILVVTRGGGSLEDLWPFNEEIVARAIATCPLPVVSAVGHETDVSIADFVADLRAPTPSAAAELLVPDAQDLKAGLAASGARLVRALRTRLSGARKDLRYVGVRHARAHPGHRLQQHAQRLDEYDRRLRGAIVAALTGRRQALGRAATLLVLHGPTRRLETLRGRAAVASQNLAQAMRSILKQRHSRLAIAARSLDTLGPQATLDRGYAIVNRVADGSVARDADRLAAGERVQIRLARGSTGATIDRDDHS